MQGRETYEAAMKKHSTSATAVALQLALQGEHVTPFGENLLVDTAQMTTLHTTLNATRGPEDLLSHEELAHQVRKDFEFAAQIAEGLGRQEIRGFLKAKPKVRGNVLGEFNFRRKVTIALERAKPTPAGGEAARRGMAA